MTELLKKYEPEIETFTLIPSDSGRFEVTVNDKLVYSKFRIGRHAEPGEISKLVGQILKDGVR